MKQLFTILLYVHFSNFKNFLLINQLGLAMRYKVLRILLTISYIVVDGPALY